MIKLFAFLIKCVVVFTIGTITLGLLEITALIMWSEYYINLAVDLHDKLLDELTFKN